MSESAIAITDFQFGHSGLVINGVKDGEPVSNTVRVRTIFDIKMYPDTCAMTIDSGSVEGPTRYTFDSLARLNNLYSSLNQRLRT